MKYFDMFAIFVLFFCSDVIGAERNYSRNFIECSAGASNGDAQASCATSEIARQKKRLNIAYANLVKKLAPDQRALLDKTQHEWITWRDDNYNFLSEHVAGSFVTTRATSLDFMLRSIFDRASELEMIADELG